MINCSKMANTVLLVLTNPARVRKLLPVIEQHVLKTLYIQYLPEKNLTSGKYNSSTLHWTSPRHFQAIANIYTLATAFLSTIDVRVLTSYTKSNPFIIKTKKSIELVIFDRTCNKSDAQVFINNCLANSRGSCDYIELNNDQDKKCLEDHPQGDGKIYENVVLGGTFDRLHNGHKIILTKAVLHCSSNITVGVTDTNMITHKLLWELIEPIQQRIDAIKDFLEDVNDHLNYNIVPINDIYGPTKSDPSFEMIVVSEETQKGAAKINQIRSENKLKILDIEVVNLFEDMQHKQNEEAKISSTNTRIRLLGARLKEPNLTGKNLKPYIIGLTGGIASGKSSVAEKLAALGAGVVHCDKLTHELYEPGQLCYNTIVQMFGSRVIGSDNKINRKALGKIVFNETTQLDRLNKAVWPKVLNAAMEEVKKLEDQGANIIIMEAAVLIQAKWHGYCHEIWTCIIPQEEAIQRVMKRNNLTREEAQQRIIVQPSNVEQVNEATVVFSTLWSHDFTLGQVQKAWDSLNEFLAKQREGMVS